MHARLIALVDESGNSSATIETLHAAGMNVQHFVRATEFIESEACQSAACVVCAFQLKDMNGLDVLGALRSRGSQIGVIFFGGDVTIRQVVCAMRAGALNFLELPVDPSELVASVREALDLHAQRVDKEHRRAAARDRLAQLTSREREVFDLVVSGLSSKEVAEKLFLSDKTIQLYRAMIARKLQTRGLAEQIRLALLLEG